MESMVNKPLCLELHLQEDPGCAGAWTKLILLSWIEQKAQELWSQAWVGILVLPLIY